MKRFLAVQHSPSEFLGAVEQQLQGRGIGFSYARPFAGQPLPASALHYDALWLLGGAAAPHERERLPWLAEELKLIEAFSRARRPAIGLGLGGLLLALAAGGAVRPQAAPQARIARARATEAGRADPLGAALDGRSVLVAAAGAVELATGSVALLADENGEWIAAKTGAYSYALLCRPELTPGMLEDMAMEEGRELPEDFGELIRRARAEWAELRRAADAAIAALVAALELMRERRKPPVFALNPVERER
jgi:GMP synthase-like glutamine amidotransferase